MFRRKYRAWKLQRPMYSQQPVQELLCYTANGEWAYIPMIDYEIHELFGNELKIYVLARIVDGKLHVKKILKGENW